MTHLSFEDLVAYFAGDHPGEETLEEHLFGCDACSREASRVAAITETLRAEIPPVLDASRLATLRARGLRVVENELRPGDRLTLEFPQQVDILLHRLAGLDLTSAETVAVRIVAESTGRTLVEVADARFDRSAGAVLIACQRHFAAFPPDTLFEVTVRGAGEQRIERYSVHHVFQTSARS